jgi:hypothetical protein
MDNPKVQGSYWELKEEAIDPLPGKHALEDAMDLSSDRLHRYMLMT